jgi:predicted GH43/DUF377 family glycosyl hydrolase
MIGDEQRDETVSIRARSEQERNDYENAMKSGTWRIFQFLRNILANEASALSFLFHHAKLMKEMKRYPVLCQKFSLQPKSLKISTPFSVCNPSLIATDEGFLATVRVHNYRLRHKGIIVEFTGGQLWNENWLLELSADLAIRSAKRIVFQEGVAVSHNGIEDIRLQRVGEDIYVIATATDWIEGTASMSFGKLQENTIKNLTFLNSPFGRKVEKNWMPLARQGNLYGVYSISPFVLVDMQDGARIAIENEGDPRLRDYRGSSQLVPWGDSWLCIVHRSAKTKGGIYYLSRFVVLNQNFLVTALSDDFFLERPGIEFCAGIAIKDDAVFITYGIFDELARVVRLNRQDVESMLRGNR